MEKKKKYSSEKHSGSRQKTKYKKKDSLKQDLQKDVKKDSKDSKKDVERSDEKNNKKDKKKVSKKSVEKKPVEETSVPVGHKEKEEKTETLLLRSKRSKKSRAKSFSDDKKPYLILILLGVVVILVFVAMLALAGRGKQAGHTGDLGNIFGSNSKVTKKEDKKKEEKVTPTNKSAEAKKAVMEADADTMYANGLYYDYANMTLNQVVEAFMADQGIESSQIAFSYKNTKTNEQFSMNDTQPMTAGSTYKLPLNMLVMDEVNRGKLSLTERFDI
ncbi:serine hydrolase, partial [Streptococcus thermophilus]